MEAYLGSPELKKTTVSAMQADIKSERLVKGHYWNGAKGCFVGCVIRGESHAKFEVQLGIPRILARLADRIFEGLDYEESKKFSVDYLKAIMPGSDLTGVWDKFIHFVLVDKKYGVIKFANTERTKKAIREIADMYKRKIAGEKIDSNAWLAARKNAYADAAAAYAAAAYAAAAYADAAYADAAYADAAAAYADAAYADAAYADAAYADAAYADAAYAAAAYAAAAYADAAYADAAYARKKYYSVLAKKLVTLLRSAPSKTV